MASSQVDSSSTPFLLTSGVVRRSGLWIMSVWKRPLTHRALPFTGASGEGGDPDDPAVLDVQIEIAAGAAQRTGGAHSV